MARPRHDPARPLSHQWSVRLYPAEWTRLSALAAVFGVLPARILRRLVRELITGGPDYFPAEQAELVQTRQQLRAIGRNLNQLARAANQGQVLNAADVREALDACTAKMEAVHAVYQRAVDTAAHRTWEPLYREAGLPSPFGEEEDPPHALPRRR